MKKTLFFLLISTFSFAQITVYENGYPRPNEYTVPITYNDYLDVSIKTQSFVKDVLEMSYDENNSGIDSDGAEVHQYLENGFGKNLGKIVFRFYALNTSKGKIYTKAEIEGNFRLILKFWAFYWPTNPKVNEDASNLIVENNYLYDKIEFWKTKKGAKLIITNTAYTPESFKKFVNTYSDKKEPVEIVEKIDLTTAEKPQTFAKSIKEDYQYLQIQFTKNKTGFNFKKELSQEIQELIKKDFAKDGPGNYTAFYDVNFLDDKPTKIKLKARLNR